MTRPTESQRAAIRRAEAIADRIRAMKRERAEAVWRAVYGEELPPLNCVHNATVGPVGWGWAPTRAHRRAAVLASELLNDWNPDRIVERLAARVWATAR